MASDLRLLIMSVASAAAISVTGVLLGNNSTADITAAVGFAAASGVLLSSDLPRLLVRQIIAVCFCACVHACVRAIVYFRACVRLYVFVRACVSACVHCVQCSPVRCSAVAAILTRAILPLLVLSKAMLVPCNLSNVGSAVSSRRSNKVAPSDAPDVESKRNLGHDGGDGGSESSGEYLVPLPPWWKRVLLWARIACYIVCSTLVYINFNLDKVAAEAANATEAAEAAAVQEGEASAAASVGSRVVVDGLVMGTCGLLFLTHQAQQVFIFGGLVRNPMHPAAMDERSVTKAKKPLRIVGWVHRIVLAAAPLVAGSYISVLHSNAAGFNPAIVALGLARAYRWACQSTSSALLEASVASLLRYAVEGVAATGPSVEPAWWSTVPLVLQLLFVGFVLDRLWDFQTKLNFVLRMFYASWSVKALRIKHTKTILILSGVFFPVVLAAILLSVALGAPLLPLFGLPVFIVGFPRPKRFWPDPGVGSSPSSDSVYYKHASPALSAYLETAFATGALGKARPGDYFLMRYLSKTAVFFFSYWGGGSQSKSTMMVVVHHCTLEPAVSHPCYRLHMLVCTTYPYIANTSHRILHRYQDNFVWIQVLERGLDFTRIAFKGLELQASKHR